MRNEVVLEPSMSNTAVVPDTLHAVRHARADDFETVRRHYGMVQDAHAAHMPGVFRPRLQWDFPFAYFEQYLNGNNLLLIAEVDGQPVGSLLATLGTVGDQHHFLQRRSATIWYVFTEPAQRRRGIAHSLISAAAEWADAKDAESIDLSVWSFNVEALALYRKLGFALARTDMTIKPSDALARCGRGYLPRPHLPKWLARR
jgi:ribosomal protein S18 acetylase RimI-like enzyme